MNWTYLEYFEVLAKNEDIPQAAEQLQISQSVLSEAIDSLEVELGVPLFDRRAHSMRLNRFGRVLQGSIVLGSNEISRGFGTIHEMSRVEKTTVSFSSVFTMGVTFVPQHIKSFQGLHPNIRLIYYQKSTKDILEDILNDNVEFGFCGEFPREGRYIGIDTETVMVEKLMLAVPLDHPLKDRENVRLKELMDEPFIGYTPNTGIIHSLGEGFAKAGCHFSALKQVYQAAEDNTVLAMVRAGLGVSIVAYNPTLYTEGVCLIPVTDPPLSRNLYMAWKRNGYMSPSAKAFKYHVLSTLKQLGSIPSRGD